MFINPHTAIKEGWIKFPDWMNDTFREKCIQPNAIDFTLDDIFEMNPLIPSESRYFRLSETTKRMRTFNRVNVEDGFFGFDIGCYDAISDFYVDIPEGVAAELIIRSTLNRNGLFITSGLYDSGFKGHIGFMLHNRGGYAEIAYHTRIAQIKFVKSDSAGMYAGGYNHKQGQHWADMKGEIQ